MSAITEKPITSIDTSLIPFIDASKNGDIPQLFRLNFDNVKRVDFDSLRVTEENREMLNELKLVMSLREVQRLESNLLLPMLNIMKQQNHPLFPVLENIAQFKHLITVPNKHSPQANNPVYQQALKDSEQVSFERLEKIFTAAWANITWPSAELNLVILDPVQDWSFPTYAVVGLCKGLISRYNEIKGIALPFTVDDEQLRLLCQTLKGKIVGEICISLKSNISLDALKEFIEIIQQARVQKMTLIGLPNGYHQEARRIAEEAKITLALSKLVR